MKSLSQNPLVVVFALLAALILAAGCQPSTVMVGQHTVRETVEVEKEVTKVVEMEKVVTAGAPAPTAAPEAGEAGPDDGLPEVPMASPYRANRLIIKNAEVRLLMADVSSGVDRVTQVASDTFGYILSARTWYEDNFEYATITIGVPVNEFEGALNRLRKMAVNVIDETASGTDVSDQYVDMESRLRNLEATEAQIRTFLDKAVDVDESLRVNQQLSDITAQIEEIKGQMNWVRDRAAYSTITVHLEPQIPTPTPMPTATATPTATPTPMPTPDVWRPDQTFNQATGVLGGIMRVVGDMAIWIVVVLGPFLLPAAAILWFAFRANRRRAQ